MRKFFFATLLGSLGLLPALASGQQYVSPSVTQTPFPAPAPVGYGVGYPYSWASTAEEGVLTGYADVIKSAGAYELNHAEALNRWEAARALDLQNARAEFNARVEFLSLQKQRASNETKEIAERNLARQSQARPISTSQRVVQHDGSIDWPVALQAAEFQPYREVIELEFERLAAGHPDAAGTIKETLDRMVTFAGNEVRANHMTAGQLTAAIGFRDNATSTARRWTNVLTNTQPPTIAAR